MSDRATRVARGQFYTSPAVADFMVGRLLVAPDAPVMEAGAGEGAFLAALERAGYADVTAFELDPSNVATLRARFAYPVVEGDFLAAPCEPRFAAAVGNPPYVAYNKIEPAVRERLLGDPLLGPLANGEWDLTYAFIVAELAHLAPGGVLSLIVPVNFFYNTHAASLRRHLAAHGAMTELVSFGEWSPFADAAPNAVIFRYVKGAKPRPVAVVEWRGRRGDEATFLAEANRALDALAADPGHVEEHDSWRAYTTPPFPADGRWTFAPPALRAAADRLRLAADGRTLGDAARVGVGYVSGADAAYRLTPAEVEALPAAERVFVISLVKSADCERFAVRGATPYARLDAIETEAELHRRAPVLAARLGDHRDLLAARYGADPVHWWRWATIRNEPLFASSDALRVFVPSIDRAPRARYAIGSGALIPGGDALGIVARGDEDPRYLAGYLNSRPLADYHEVYGGATGHRRRYTQAVIEALPCPKPTPEIHDAVVAAIAALGAGGISEAEADLLIDAAIEELIAHGIAERDSSR